MEQCLTASAGIEAQSHSPDQRPQQGPERVRSVLWGMAHEMSLAAGCANVIVLPWSSRWRRTAHGRLRTSPACELNDRAQSAAVTRCREPNSSNGRQTDIHPSTPEPILRLMPKLARRHPFDFQKASIEI